MKFKKYITAPAPTLLALFRDDWDTDDTNTNLRYCGISGRSHVWQSCVNPSLTYRWTPLTGWVRAIVDHCVMGDPTGKTMGQVLNPRVPMATLRQRRKEHGIPYEVFGKSLMPNTLLPDVMRAIFKWAARLHAWPTLVLKLQHGTILFEYY